MNGQTNLNNGNESETVKPSEDVIAENSENLNNKLASSESSNSSSRSSSNQNSRQTPNPNELTNSLNVINKTENIKKLIET